MNKLSKDMRLSLKMALIVSINKWFEGKSFDMSYLKNNGNMGILKITKKELMKYAFKKIPR